MGRWWGKGKGYVGESLHGEWSYLSHGRLWAKGICPDVALLYREKTYHSPNGYKSKKAILPRSLSRLEGRTDNRLYLLSLFRPAENLATTILDFS
jgi:hypothetical protein